MPGDITGSMVIDSSRGELSLPRGAGLHQPAARRRDQPHAAQDPVGAARGDGGGAGLGRRRLAAPLPRPFLVAATQNPVEYEGTYPLPEAQLDRFLLKVVLPVPDRAEELEILRRHADGFDPRDVAAAGRDAPSPAPPTSPPAARAVRRGAGLARGRRLRRRHRPRHPAVAVARPRRQPPRRDRAAAHGAGLGVAVGPRLRDARRRQGAGPGDAGAPARRCGPRPSSRASTSAPCSPPRSAPSRSRAEVRGSDGDHRAGPAAAPAGAGGGACCARAVGTVWLWLLVVLSLVRRRLAARARRRGALGRAGARRRGCGSASPTETVLVVAQHRRPRARRCWCATPGSRPPARTTTGTGSGSAPATSVALTTAAAARRRGELRARRRHRAHAAARSGWPPGSAPARSPGVGAVAAAVRVPQAPAVAAGPAARPRRPVGGAGARPGHGVRLAARVRPRRRRPLDRLAGHARATATSWSAPGSPSATGGWCWCSTRRAPRPGRVDDVPRLDSAMEAALLLTALAARAGDRVDFVAGDRRVRTRLRLAGARDATSRLEDAHGRPPAGDRRGRLDRAGRRGAAAFGRQRALVVLLTPLEPSAVEEGLLPVLPVAGHAPPRGAASVRDPELERLAAARGTASTRCTPPPRPSRPWPGGAPPPTCCATLGVDVLDVPPTQLPPGPGRPLPRPQGPRPALSWIAPARSRGFVARRAARSGAPAATAARDGPLRPGWRRGPRGAAGRGRRCGRGATAWRPSTKT